MEVTIRKPRPGETCFGGGIGIMIPFRFDQTDSSKEPAESESKPQEAAQHAADSAQPSPETQQNVPARQLLNSLLMGHLGPLPMDSE